MKREIYYILALEWLYPRGSSRQDIYNRYLLFITGILLLLIIFLVISFIMDNFSTAQNQAINDRENILNRGDRLINARERILDSIDRAANARDRQLNAEDRRLNKIERDTIQARRERANDRIERWERMMKDESSK